MSTHSLISHEYNKILLLEGARKALSLIVDEVEMTDTSLSGVKYKEFYEVEKRIPYNIKSNENKNIYEFSYDINNKCLLLGAAGSGKSTLLNEEFLKKAYSYLSLSKDLLSVYYKDLDTYNSIKNKRKKDKFYEKNLSLSIDSLMNFIDNTKLPILIPSKLINREHKELNDTLKSFIGINPDLSIFSVNLYLDALDELDFEINDYVLNLINQYSVFITLRDYYYNKNKRFFKNSHLFYLTNIEYEDKKTYILEYIKSKDLLIDKKDEIMSIVEKCKYVLNTPLMITLFLESVSDALFIDSINDDDFESNYLEIEILDYSIKKYIERMISKNITLFNNVDSDSIFNFMSVLAWNEKKNIFLSRNNDVLVKPFKYEDLVNDSVSLLNKMYNCSLGIDVSRLITENLYKETSDSINNYERIFHKKFYDFLTTYFIYYAIENDSFDELPPSIPLKTTIMNYLILMLDKMPGIVYKWLKAELNSIKNTLEYQKYGELFYIARHIKTINILDLLKEELKSKDNYFYLTIIYDSIIQLPSSGPKKMIDLEELLSYEEEYYNKLNTDFIKADVGSRLSYAGDLDYDNNGNPVMDDESSSFDNLYEKYRLHSNELNYRVDKHYFLRRIEARILRYLVLTRNINDSQKAKIEVFINEALNNSKSVIDKENNTLIIEYEKKIINEINELSALIK